MILLVKGEKNKALEKGKPLDWKLLTNPLVVKYQYTSLFL